MFTTKFSNRYDQVVTEFNALAPDLRQAEDPDEGRLNQINTAFPRAQAHLEAAQEGIGRFTNGWTGAKSGHKKTAIPFTAAAFFAITAQTGFTIYNFVEDMDKEEADKTVGSFELINQGATWVFVTVSIICWALHSWNARDAAKAASVRESDEDTIYWIHAYTRAAHELSTGIGTAEAPDVLGPRFLLLDACYRALPSEQQALLGDISAIKERYVNRLADDHKFKLKLRRMQVMAQAAQNLINANGNLKLRDDDNEVIDHGIEAADLAATFQLASNSLDNANGSLAALQAVNADLYARILAHPKLTKALLCIQWSGLEKHIGSLERISLPDGGAYFEKHRRSVGAINSPFLQRLNTRMNELNQRRNPAGAVVPIFDIV